MEKTVNIPVSLFKKMSKATQAFQEFEDELEDFLLTSDPQFIASGLSS